MRHPMVLLACVMIGAPPPASEAAEPAPAAPPDAAQAFIPEGWRIETRAEGDLDGDGAADLVLVLIEETTPGSLDYDAAWPDIAPPRTLVVAFARPRGGYGRPLRSHDFLPRKRPPNGLSEGWMLFEEGSVEVSGGRLRILFEYTRANTTFTFRWQDGALRLIGYDRGGVSGGCFAGLSINYLTRRAKMTAGWIDREQELVRWRRLTRRPLLALDEIGDGEEFDPLAPASFDLWCPDRE